MTTPDLPYLSQPAAGSEIGYGDGASASPGASFATGSGAGLESDRQAEDRRRFKWEIATLVGAQLVLGAFAGVVWRLWAPHTVGYLVPDQHGSTVFIPAEAENQIAGDGRFLLVTVLAGLIAALGAWFLMRRRRGPIVLVSLVVGSLAGSLLARWVGEALSSGHTTGSDPTVVYPALTVHAQPILLFQAFAAVLLYVALAGFTSDRDFTAPARAFDGETDVLTSGRA